MYNKLFTKILDSSIWLEKNTTRIVWLTLIAAMDEDGFCQFASSANLAHRAIVDPKECDEAIKCLESEDPNSSDKEHDGKRIERVPGGWMVLNSAKYKDLVTREISKERTRERVRRHREKYKEVTKCNVPVQNCNVSVTQSDTDTKTESKTEKNTYCPVCKEVIEYLNLKAGTSFRNVKSNDDFIIARIKEGATVADLKSVIDLKCKDWLGKPEAKYLRPETLFNATKFNSYVGLSSVKQGEKKWI